MRSAEIQRLIDAVEGLHGPVTLYGSDASEEHGTCFRIPGAPATLSAHTQEGHLSPGLYDCQIEGYPPPSYIYTCVVSLDALLRLIERMRGPEDEWPVDLLLLLNRVARAMESVVPGLLLAAEATGPIWFEDEDDKTDGGEWGTMLGFGIAYRDVEHGTFHVGSSGSERELTDIAALELMSQVQDVVAETTKEPWPPTIVDNRRDMAMASTVVEGNRLYMWYGERRAPALQLPSVDLRA